MRYSCKLVRLPDESTPPRLFVRRDTLTGLRGERRESAYVIAEAPLRLVSEREPRTQSSTVYLTDAGGRVLREEAGLRTEEEAEASFRRLDGVREHLSGSGSQLQERLENGPTDFRVRRTLMRSFVLRRALWPLLPGVALGMVEMPGLAHGALWLVAGLLVLLTGQDRVENGLVDEPAVRTPGIVLVGLLLLALFATFGLAMLSRSSELGAALLAAWWAGLTPVAAWLGGTAVGVLADSLSPKRGWEVLRHRIEGPVLGECRIVSFLATEAESERSVLAVGVQDETGRVVRRTTLRWEVERIPAPDEALDLLALEAEVMLDEAVRESGRGPEVAGARLQQLEAGVESLGI